MRHAIFPESTELRRLPFYLAAEEWIARNVSGDCFFAWNIPPTVICGRNQDVACEVNLDFCRKRNIGVYRRKSGGGAVFADYNNIMFSCVLKEQSVAEAFGEYTARVVGALRLLGLDAKASGRNDIMIGDSKVAGNACRICSGRSIVHGTMLFDTDYEIMAGALTPSVSKLKSNKVKSVAARVTTIRRYLPDLGREEFLQHVIDNVCDANICLPAHAEAEINAMTAEYAREDCAERRDGSGAHEMRVPGAGSVGARVELRDGRIKQVDLFGDFFSEREPAVALAALNGLNAGDVVSIEDALGSGNVVAGVSNRMLAEIISRSANMIKI